MTSYILIDKLMWWRRQQFHCSWLATHSIPCQPMNRHNWSRRYELPKLARIRNRSIERPLVQMEKISRSATGTTERPVSRPCLPVICLLRTEDHSRQHRLPCRAVQPDRKSAWGQVFFSVGYMIQIWFHPRCKTSMRLTLLLPYTPF